MASTGPDHLARVLLEWLDGRLAPFRQRLALIGGLAVNQLRRPRFTDDIDFMVSSDAQTLPAIVRRLNEDGYEVVKSFGEGQASGADFVRLLKAGQPAIEFMTAKTEFQVAVIDRATAVEGLQGIRIATAEDLIVLKLIANRSVDHLDLLELGRSKDIDWSYVERWAPIWDVSDRLADLRAFLARPE